MTNPLSLPVSIVVCTHNRADLLRVAVESLLAQGVSQDSFELIIVDNASTDHTSMVAQQFCKTHSNVRYVVETDIGLSSARNRGWREARGRYVGYLDDDCKIPPGWMAVAFEIIERIKPEAFGGPYYPFYNSTKPKWFKDEYASHVMGSIARPLNNDEYLSGGNMLIKRELLRSLDGFRRNLGMTGDKIGYGEETYFFNRLRSQNPQAILYYEPRLFVYHLVRAEKMNLSKVPCRHFNVGRFSYRVFYQIKKKPTFHYVIKIFLTLIKTLNTYTVGVITRDRGKYPLYENYIYENGSRNFITLGQQVEALFHVIGLSG